MEEPGDPEELEGSEAETLTWPLVGALYGSLVIVAVIAIFESSFGRGFEDEIDAPARALVAAPVVIAAAVVFLASMLALVLPQYRRAALRVAEIGGWLIPAWLVMSAMVIGAVAFALQHAD